MFMGEGVDDMVNVGLKTADVPSGSSPDNDTVVVVNVKNNEGADEDELEPPKLSVK
jgi:hypothetical protein